MIKCQLCRYSETGVCCTYNVLDLGEVWHYCYFVGYNTFVLD